MRAITKITINEADNGLQMFLTYNNDDNDYSFSNHYTLEEALEALPNNDLYFPIKADFYEYGKIGERKKYKFQ